MSRSSDSLFVLLATRRSFVCLYVAVGLENTRKSIIRVSRYTNSDQAINVEFLYHFDVSVIKKLKWLESNDVMPSFILQDFFIVCRASCAATVAFVGYLFSQQAVASGTRTCEVRGRGRPSQRNRSVGLTRPRDITSKATNT